jgi:N-acetylglutamate synthase-like GNAT family acetyltransferase
MYKDKKHSKTGSCMKIISIRENPEYKDTAIRYFQEKWPTVLPVIYEDCINHSIVAMNALPQWYLLEKDGEIIGCAGLITNDFISRMDLYPWICAIYVEEKHRGNNYASLLIDKSKADSKKAGFDYLYLSTDHTGYYEKLGFSYIGQGYHPWGDESRIYQCKL